MIFQVSIQIMIITFLIGSVAGWYSRRALVVARQVVRAVQAERERRAKERFGRDLDRWIAEIDKERSEGL